MLTVAAAADVGGDDDAVQLDATIKDRLSRLMTDGEGWSPYEIWIQLQQLVMV